MKLLKKQNPLKIPKERIDYILLALSWLGWLSLILLPAFYYQELPDRIPIHFNSKGEADGWDDKFAIWELAFIGSILFFGILILMNNPHWLNYPVKITEENAKRQYRLGSRLLSAINAIITLLFAYSCYGIIQNGQGNQEGIGLAIPIIAMILILGIIFYFLFVAYKRS